MSYSKQIILSVLILIFTWKGMSLGATGMESLLPKDIPDGWALIDGPHTYTKKTLFGHIDGQAELYFKYGFQKSVFAIYQNKKSPENQIELDIYDMGNVLRAFGIFSRFRNEDRPAGIGLDSCLDDRSAFFYKGRYFVMLYATESNLSILKEFSTIVSLKISDPSPPPKEIGYFPKNGLKPGSIQYFPEGVLGHEFLKRGFQGTYIEKEEDKVEVKVEAEDKANTGSKEFRLFFAIFENPRDAMSALKTYKDYLSKRGKIHLNPPIGFGPHSFRAEDPYQGQITVTQKGIYLLGAIGFKEAKDGEDRLAEIMKEVK
jgi:hypothetical protein